MISLDVDRRAAGKDSPKMTNHLLAINWRNALFASACLAVSASGGSAADAPTPMSSTASAPGYLAPEALPDSVALLPQPPVEGSAALALDQEVSTTDLALRDTPRWKLAAMDADLSFPWAAGDFSCALKAPVNEQDTPRLYQLLLRSRADAGGATAAAKNRYMRLRPFQANKAPTCTPAAENDLAKNGSYPSGHTSIGWAWALILSEVAPEQSGAILARGRSFGESRLICNVHWESDVIEGRNVGAGTVARLHADPAFVADVAAAKSELAAARAKNLSPQRDCPAEADALGQQPFQAP
jgi:acid phosphatase (class A)